MAKGARVTEGRQAGCRTSYWISAGSESGGRYSKQAITFWGNNFICLCCVFMVTNVRFVHYLLFHHWKDATGVGAPWGTAKKKYILDNNKKNDKSNLLMEFLPLILFLYNDNIQKYCKVLWKALYESNPLILLLLLLLFLYDDGVKPGLISSLTVLYGLLKLQKRSAACSILDLFEQLFECHWSVHLSSGFLKWRHKTKTKRIQKKARKRNLKKKNH